MTAAVVVVPPELDAGGFLEPPQAATRTAVSPASARVRAERLRRLVFMAPLYAPTGAGPVTSVVTPL